MTNTTIRRGPRPTLAGTLVVLYAITFLALLVGGLVTLPTRLARQAPSSADAAS